MQTQTIRQWIVPHEWMTKPTAQTEWIEKQGLLVWLSEVFSALGTGLYLVSIFVNNWWGALIGFLIVMLLKLPVVCIFSIFSFAFRISKYSIIFKARFLIDLPYRASTLLCTSSSIPPESLNSICTLQSERILPP